MSWSNIPDYMEYNEFHHLAQACSASTSDSIRHETIHYGYSMNWSHDVHGCYILDYEDASMRKELLDEANNHVKKKYDLYGWTPYLRWPPPVNPINTTGEFLQIAFFQSWVQHFMSFGSRNGFCQVLHSARAIGSPIASTGTFTIFMRWTL